MSTSGNFPIWVSDTANVNDTTIPVYQSASVSSTQLGVLQADQHEVCFMVQENYLQDTVNGYSGYWQHIIFLDPSAVWSDGYVFFNYSNNVGQNHDDVDKGIQPFGNWINSQYQQQTTISGNSCVWWGNNQSTDVYNPDGSYNSTQSGPPNEHYYAMYWDSSNTLQIVCGYYDSERNMINMRYESPDSTNWTYFDGWMDAGFNLGPGKYKINF